MNIRIWEWEQDDDDDDDDDDGNDNDNNSIQFFIYLRADSTPIGLLQSQHGHIQQKQWTAQRQYIKTSGLYRQVLNLIYKILVSQC
jgi:hypothetical protein